MNKGVKMSLLLNQVSIQGIVANCIRLKSGLWGLMAGGVDLDKRKLSNASFVFDIANTIRQCLIDPYNQTSFCLIDNIFFRPR